MAREYARIKVGIWADPDFRKLTDPAQSLYFRLLSSPTMTLCGVADWRPRRLAALTAGMTHEGVNAAAAELADRGYIVVDDDTEEVLVRSFVRHDGLIKTPNIAAAMVKDYAGTASSTLRGVIVHELRRLHEDEPDMKGWATASKLLDHEAIDPSGIPSAQNPSGKASGKASPIPSGNESHIPHPASINQQPSSTGRKKRPATRLPQGFEPNEDHITLATSLGVNLHHEFAKFRDYWIGEGKTKVDWDATLRNWIRNAAERNGNVMPIRPAVGGDGQPVLPPLPLDDKR